MKHTGSWLLRQGSKLHPLLWQNLNHRTTKEAPILLTFKKKIKSIYMSKKAEPSP